MTLLKDYFNTGGGGGSFTMNIIDLVQGTMQQHDSTGDLAIEWKIQESTDANFSHSTDTNPEQITCLTPGWLHIVAQVQYDQDDGGRLNTESFLTINSTKLVRSTGNRSYYRGLNYGRWGTAQLNLYLEVSANDIIELHSQVADGATAFGANRAIDTVPTSTFMQIRFLG